ncbi:MAG TPA: cytochrome c1 [Phenylobacterium sp.]|nr:cytochrome c1 [Phenylobacterium sp.]
MMERKQFGLGAMVYLLIFTVLLYFSYRRIWRNVAH